MYTVLEWRNREWWRWTCQREPFKIISFVKVDPQPEAPKL